MNTTVIIPVAPYHNEIFTRAATSVRNQTTPCRLIYAFDEDSRGPGYIRNQLLADVKTPYTVFLDADDWLDERFVEICESAIEPNRYVYTDWWQGDTYVHAPERAWCGGTWHVITAMVHTDDARKVGGFDETLPALEDTDFWLKMVTNRICGIWIRNPLSNYSKGGIRAQTVHNSGEVEQLRLKVNERYNGQMGCCGGELKVDTGIPVGERQPNDVRGMAKWRGNRKEYGRASGRWYPYMSWPKVTWMDPRDIEMDPNNWQQVIEPAVNDPTPVATNLDAFDRVFHRPKPPTPATPVDTEAVDPIPIPQSAPDFSPDVDRIVAVAQERLQDE